MNILKDIKFIIRHILYENILCRRYDFNYNISELKNKNIVDIYTIAFNNEDVICSQYMLLKKNFKDPFNYTVADNSNIIEKQKKIFEFCKKNNISYVKVKQRLFPRMKHPDAINWIYHNYIKHRKANYVGILDHDVFPIKPVEIIKYLQEVPLYGLIQTRNDKWYLWPGFNFFRFDFLMNKKIDFSTCSELNMDTGGTNWYSLYKDFDRNKLIPVDQSYKNIRTGIDLKFPEGNAQSDLIEFFDEKWIHTICASGWTEIGNKNQVVKNILESYLESDNPEAIELDTILTKVI